MIRIPDTNKKLSQPNNSDLFGNLWYTKNINLDEEGYIKLSSRTAAIISEGDSSNFNIPTSFGRNSSDYFIVTQTSPYIATLDGTTLSVIEDTDSGGVSVPNLTSNSFGKWWQGAWHVTESNELFYKTVLNGNWSNASVSLTSGVKHPLEVFRSRNTLCIGNGNILKQVTTGYATTDQGQLTLPTDFEIVGCSYNNNKMGVITKMSSTASGQNSEAFFYIWDGKEDSPNSGYSVGSDFIYAIVPYKSSWALLTRTGQWKFFNGGGFEDLSALPSYYLNFIQGDSTNNELFGDSAIAEGDVVYINMPAQADSFGRKSETQLQNFPAGVHCYDPKIGIYHRYSPSISKATLLTVTTSNVDVSTDILTKTAGTVPETGSPIKYVSNQSDLIGGLSVGRVYFAIKKSSTTFQLAATQEDANNFTPIDLTSQAVGTSYFLGINILDYGTTRTGQTGGIALTGAQNQIFNHVIFGGEYFRHDATTDYVRACITVPGFPNRGFFVTPKITSSNVEDNVQKLFIKYRPLGAEDKIVLKYKDKDVYGIPVSTPQGSTHCSWTNPNTLTTTADLTEVESYINDDGGECEVEIVSGAGGGQMAQISTISYLSGTYTITLDEDIEGALSGRYCDIIVDNWKKIGEITSSDSVGWKELSVNLASKWAKYKVEMRGIEVTVEEVQIISDTQIPSA